MQDRSPKRKTMLKNTAFTLHNNFLTILKTLLVKRLKTNKYTIRKYHIFSQKKVEVRICLTLKKGNVKKT